MPPASDNRAGARQGRHLVSALPVHVVFVTTYRHGALDEGMPRSCEDATRKFCADFGAELQEFNDQDDHVHLLAGYPPKVAVPALVNSSRGRRRGRCDRSSPAG